MSGRERESGRWAHGGAGRVGRWPAEEAVGVASWNGQQLVFHFNTSDPR